MSCCEQKCLRSCLTRKHYGALIVKGSAYAEHVYEIAETYELIISLPAIIEVIMAIYKVFSNHGENFRRGFEAVIQAMNKLKRILENQTEYGIKAKILIIDDLTVFKAVELLKKHSDLFVKEGPRKTRWLRVFDAIIAAVWLTKKIPLLADDPVYEKISREYKLQYIKLKKKI